MVLSRLCSRNCLCEGLTGAEGSQNLLCWGWQGVVFWQSSARPHCPWLVWTGIEEETLPKEGLQDSNVV